MKTKIPIALFAWKYIIYPLFVICQIPFLPILIILKYNKGTNINDEKFDYNTFNSLNKKEKRSYCNRFLTYLGEGASRSTYRLGKFFVLKVSKRRRNMQNKCEGYLHKHPMILFARVYEVGENYDWIISEYARRAKKDDFERLAGISFSKVSAWILNRMGLYFFFKLFRSTRYSKKDLNEINDLPFIKELKKLPRRNLMDISKLDSWGVRTYKDGTEQLIIIDSGLCLKSMLKNG